MPLFERIGDKHRRHGKEAKSRKGVHLTVLYRGSHCFRETWRGAFRIWFLRLAGTEDYFSCRSFALHALPYNLGRPKLQNGSPTRYGLGKGRTARVSSFTLPASSHAWM